MKPENEQNEPEVVEVDLDKVAQARQEMAQAMLSAAHNWRQTGTLVSCTSCPFQHGFAVPPRMRLQGLDAQGHPILKEVI